MLLKALQASGLYFQTYSKRKEAFPNMYSSGFEFVN